MQNAEYSVALTHLVDKLKLENCTPNVPIDDVKVTQSDVNRPALQLAGFFDYFDSNRIQIIGQVEYTYMEQKGVEYSVQMLEEIMCGSEKSTKPPCIVFCRNLPVDDRLIELATKYQVPILRTKRATNEFMADLIQCLNYNMAPRCTVHGVLVDIYGEGILIMGESGIGKSEVALRREVHIQNEDGTVSQEIKERTYDLKCTEQGRMIQVSIPASVPLKEFDYNTEVEIINPVADTVATATFQGADVDWYIKADDIVLKNKNGQPAGNNHAPNNPQQPQHKK